MLRIECVHCGVRDEEEFTFGGPAHVNRPGPECSDAEWADYLFNRDNPKGVHHERWCHSFGCRRWFNVARDTMTHEVLAVYRMGEPKPDPDAGGIAGRARAAVSKAARAIAAPGEGGSRPPGDFMEEDVGR